MVAKNMNECLQCPEEKIIVSSRLLIKYEKSMKKYLRGKNTYTLFLLNHSLELNEIYATVNDVRTRSVYQDTKDLQEKDGRSQCDPQSFQPRSMQEDGWLQ